MPRGRPLEVDQELIEAFKRSGQVTEYLASVVPVAVWRSPPPGGRGRTIAAIIAHIQGVRRTFARMGGVRPGPPALDKQRMTPDEACAELRESTNDLVRLIQVALPSTHAQVNNMPRPTINMLTY